MSNSIKKTVQIILVFAIGAAFLYFVFKETNWEDLWQKFLITNYWWISVGLVISIFSHWLRAKRAVLLYEAIGYKISTTNSFHAVIIGYFINYFIPRGGEVSRCAALYKTDGFPVEKSLGTVITERIVDMILLVVVVGLVFILQFDLIYTYIETNLGKSQTNSGNNSIKIYLIIAVALVFVLLFLLRKNISKLPLYGVIKEKIIGFLDGLLSIKQLKKPTLFIVYSIGIWLCYIVMMYVCFLSLDATASLTFAQSLTVFAMGSIAMIIPAPGAGAGTYHFAVMQGLLLFGVSQADGIAYATIVHAAQMLLFFVIGPISSIFVLRNKKIH